MDPEFLIRIIVRARNEIAGVLDKAAGEVDKLTGAQERQIQSTEKTTKASKDLKGEVTSLQTEYRKFTEQVAKGEKDFDAARFGLERLAGEMDKLAKKTPIGSRLSEDLHKSALGAREVIRQMELVRDADRRITEQTTKDRERAEQERQRMVEASRQESIKAEQRRADAERKIAESETADKVRQEQERQRSGEARRQAELKAEEAASKRRSAFVMDILGAINERDRQMEANERNLADFQIKESSRVESERTQARLDWERNDVRALRHVAQEAERTGGFMRRLFNVSPERAREMDDALEKFERTLNRNRFSVAALDNRLRGLLLLGLIAFFQQVVSVVGALGATFISVAASATEAAIAMAAMASTAAAQAVPAIGLLIAAFGRVGAVFDAVQQASKAAMRAGDEHSQSMQRQRDAAIRVEEAQSSLTQARVAARREIEQLIAAEQRAEEQAKRASLTQEEAQRSLRRAIATGDVDALAGAQLSAEEADTGVTTSRTELGQARRASARAQRPGAVERMPSVVSARRNLEQAREAARRTADEVSRTQTVLAQLLAQLSPAERTLYRTLLNIRDTYKRNFRPITDIIVLGFNDALVRVTKLMDDPRILRPLTTLARGIRNATGRLTGEFTSGASVSWLGMMARESERSLGPLTTIAIMLSRVFRNVSEAGIPAFRRFLDYLVEITKTWSAATGSGSGMQKMRKFFLEGEEMAEGFFNLLRSIGRLFLAVIGPAAGEGQIAVRDLTAEIDKATSWINRHQEETRKFFEGARMATYELARALVAIVQALADLYHPDQVRILVDAFTESLLPALVVVAEVVGNLTGLFLTFLGTPVGSVMGEWGVATLLLFKFFSPLVVMFGSAIRLIAALTGSLRLAGIAFTTLNIATGPIGVAIMAIVAAIAILDQKFHFIGPTIDWITNNIEKLLPVLAALAIRFSFFGGGGGAAGAISSIGGLSKVVGGLRAAFMALAGGQGIGAAIAALRRYITTAGVASAVTAGAGGAGAAGAGAAGAAAGGGLLGRLSRFLRLPGVGLAGGLAGGALTAGLVAPDIQRAISPTGDFNIPTGGRGFQTFLRNPIGTTLGADPTGDADQELRRFGDRLEEVKGKLKELTPTELRELRREAVRLSRDKNLEEWRDELGKVIRTLDRIKPHAQNISDILNEETLGKVLRNFRTLRDGAFKSIDGLRDHFRNNVLRINDAASQGSELWASLMTRNFRSGIVGVKSMIEDGTISVRTGMREINRITQRQMAFVRDNMDNLSLEAKDRLAGNFRAARLAIIEQIGGIENASEKTLKRIRRLMVAEFKLYGLSESQARELAMNRTTPGRENVNQWGGPEEGGSATGGWLGKQGERGADGSAGLLHGRRVGRGEGVINWAHQKYIEPAMNWFYGHGLDTMFKRVRGSHAMELAGGFARGGLFDGHPSNVAPGLVRLTEIMKRRFPGLSVSSTTDHSLRTTSGNVSDHSTGHAVDMSTGDYGYMNRAAAWIKSSGLYRQLKQGIHNPNLAVNAGVLQQPPGQFGGAVWAQHLNHIHLAIAGMVRGTFHSMASLRRRIDRIIKNNLGTTEGGMVGGLARLGARQVGAAAIRNLRMAAADAADHGDFDTGAKFSGGSEAIARAVARAWRSRRRPLEALLSAFETVLVEAGGMFNPDHGDQDSLGSFQQRASWGSAASRMNPFESAMRFFARWRDVGSPGQSAQAVQRSAYPDKYDAAESSARRWLRRIGFTQFAQGGEIPGMLGQAVPILAHAKEWVLNLGQQGMLANALGMGRDGLRGWLGLGIGSSSAQAGTEVSAAANKPRDFQIPTIPPETVRGLVSLAQDLVKFLRGTGLGDKAGQERFRRAFLELAGDGGILDQLSDAVERMTTTLSVRLRRATFKVTKTGEVIRRLSVNEVAERELNQLERVYAALMDERGVLARSLRGVTNRLEQISKDGVTKKERGSFDRLRGFQRTLQRRLEALDDNIATNVESRFSAIEERITARVGRVDTRAERRLGVLGLRQRAAALLGTQAGAFGLGAQALAGERVSILGDQADQLQRAADAARRRGRGDIARDIERRIADLRQQMADTVAEGISGAIQEVAARTQRGQVALDLRNRLADLTERAGDFVSAFAQRGSVLGQRGALLQGQRSDLQGLLLQAQATGNLGLVEQITDQLAELDVALQENTAAIESNTVQARQAAINAITGRGGFLTGVFGNLNNLLQVLGVISGTTDIPGQRGLLGQIGGVLRQTGGGLRDQLFQGFGVDLRGLGGNDLISTLSRLNFDEIQANFTVEQRDQFQSLINSVIENATAVEQNTQALNELDNTINIQTFSTTAWQLFRQAIIVGNQLLPQYQIPMMHSGGSIWHEGPYWLAPGEVYVSEGARKAGSNGDVSKELHLHVTNPSEILDVDYVLERGAWEMQHDPYGG